MSEKDIFAWYERLYTDVDNSETYAKYCKLAFGNDFSQQGFSDSKQIGFMLSKLNVGEHKKVLDIGCGTGKLDEYIHDLTRADITGIDYSPNAIGMAKERTSSKPGLSFYCRDMDSIDYPDDSFDIVFSIDAIFFSADLVNLLKKINKMLKKDGMLSVYYSEIKFDESASVDILRVENTLLGQALKAAGLNYSYFDVSDNLYEHMLLKRKIGLTLKEDFASEGMNYLFDYIYDESIPEDMSIEAFKKFQSRFLYLYQK